MITPANILNDDLRIKRLREYKILHTPKEDEYEQITDLAANITQMPIALVSLVDKNEVWFKSSKGMDICSSPRELSFCNYAINHKSDVFIIENAKIHPDFCDHPYVNNGEESVIFYAGVCLIDADGYRLGTLCVIDNKPNTISEKNIKSLKILSKQIIKLIELNASKDSLENLKINLEKKNAELKDFAGIVSHDMKMPLANIIVTTDILKAKYASSLDDQAKQYLKYLKDSSFTLSDYITGLLEHYESDKLIEEINDSFDIHHLLEEIVDLLNINLDCEIHFPEKNIELTCNRAALEQIFLNLIGNSLKYNDKKRMVITIDCVEDLEYYNFKITDNGVGIPQEKLSTIFDLFSTVGNLDRDGKKGNGIGLSTVKKLIDNLGGTIAVTSEYGAGTIFSFNIKK